MAIIDLIVLGMLKNEALSAYEIQKLVDYRKISEWIKISTPSIYKKVLKLEEKGLVSGKNVRVGKMPEKTVYSLTASGEEEFEKLMLEVSCNPINMYLDFNAVIVNLDKLSSEQQKLCISNIEEKIQVLKRYLEENIREKKDLKEIPATGFAVLEQQYILVQAIETWIASVNHQ